LSHAPECIQQTRTDAAKVYECGSDIGPLFLTALRACAIPEKLSYQATTRELLVGMTNIEVVRQEPVQLGSTKALHSVVSGMLDADPVRLSTFTLRKGDCITDLIMWDFVVENIASTDPSHSTFAAVSTALAQRLATSPLIDEGSSDASD